MTDEANEEAGAGGGEGGNLFDSWSFYAIMAMAVFLDGQFLPLSILIPG